jgi:hypothetical protein
LASVRSVVRLTHDAPTCDDAGREASKNRYRMAASRRSTGHPTARFGSATLHKRGIRPRLAVLYEKNLIALSADTYPGELPFLGYLLLKREMAVARLSWGSPRLAVLAHPALAGPVAVLVVNDHVLKVRLPGWWTGKLSDLAGVFPVAAVAGARAARR